MPQPFNNAVMTNGGAQLLTMAQAGEIRIQFTRMAIGNGVYREEDKEMSVLQAVTAMKAEKNSYPLSDIEVFSEHSVKVTALITNWDSVTQTTLIDAGYYINEIGLFAKPAGDEGNENEVLYSLAVTSGNNGDIMPPYNGYHPAQIIQEYYVTVNNSAEVTIQTGTGAVALAEDLAELADEENIERAFYTVFTNIAAGGIDEMALSAQDIERIISVPWDGNTSDDETALSSQDIEKALSTEWDGRTSDDEEALSSQDIKKALKM